MKLVLGSKSKLKKQWLAGFELGPREDVCSSLRLRGIIFSGSTAYRSRQDPEGYRHTVDLIKLYDESLRGVEVCGKAVRPLDRGQVRVSVAAPEPGWWSRQVSRIPGGVPQWSKEWDVGDVPKRDSIVALVISLGKV